MTIYRGFDIEQRKADENTGAGFFWTDASRIEYGPYNSEDEAMDGIDKHKKALAQARA